MDYFDYFSSPEKDLKDNGYHITGNDWDFEILHCQQQTHNLRFHRIMRYCYQVIQTILGEKSWFVQYHDGIHHQEANLKI